MSNSANTHIEITPGVCGGKPRIAGHRIRVQDIALWHDFQGLSPEEILGRFPQLSLAQVHAALAYYFDHRRQIQQEIQEDRQFAEKLKAGAPSTLASKLIETDASGDPVSS
jgi:uncharacterized protein (DUF433 family)